jgi:hypothetical protein
MKRARKLPVPPSPAPSYSDHEAWLDLWLHADRDPRRKPAPSYLAILNRAMRLVTDTDDTREELLTEDEADVAHMRDEILTAIGGIMSARKAAHAAADVYLTARSVLDGAIGRWTGEEHEDEVLSPAPADDDEPPPWEQTTRATTPGTAASAPRLDWHDRAACLAWLEDLTERIRDLESAAEDATDAPSKRQLGRAAAVQLVGEAGSSIADLLACAARGLSEPGDDGAGEPGAAPLH